MHLDLDKMQEIVRQSYTVEISQQYGNLGLMAMRHLMITLRKLYQHLTPELINGSLIVFKLLDDGIHMPYLSEPTGSFDLPEYLVQDYDMSAGNIIQLRANGDFHLWNNASLDLTTLSNDAVVYLYEQRAEYFVIRGDKKQLVNPSRVHASIFATPTFRSLEKALEDYKWKRVRRSGCKIFSTAWYGGETGNRLFFKSGPESILRDSLRQYLSDVLGAEVRPEQIVDESHPCDIKVTWTQTNRLAWIEIKWLGKAISGDMRITQNFSESRARDGADQLADYLDANLMKAPTHESRGYLVVIDARRYRLNESSISVNSRNGLYYKDNEIEYDPAYHEIRSDFHPPIRMFAEPICRPD